MISIIGSYTTQFGELWDKALFDLVHEAIDKGVHSAHVEKEELDAVFFGNMLGGIVSNQLLPSGQIAEYLGLHIPVYKTEGACASGGLACNLAYQYLLANPKKTVLVLGAEKMTDVPTEEITRGLSSAASVEEQEVGLTFPGLYGMLAQIYLSTYGYTEEHLAHVSVKNHVHGRKNPNAQFRREITVDQVLQSPYVSHPLKVLDSSPISDGAAALVLSNDSSRIKKNRSVRILASETATDSISLRGRKSLTSLPATQEAARKAFQAAQVTPADIQVAEVHDCFSIAEMLAMEDLGFWNQGEAGKHMEAYETQLGNHGSIIVNTSGGLKACGHPVGATGIKQLHELYLQLTNQAQDRQVPHVTRGLAHNVGGSGGVAVVTIVGS